MRKKIFIIIGLIVCIAILAVIGLKFFPASQPLPVKNDEAKNLDGLLAAAENAERRGDLLFAKKCYSNAISEFPNSAKISQIEKRSEDLNIKVIFSSLNTPQAKIYTVKGGDSLFKIAKELKISLELLKRSNNLTSDRIVVGQKLRIWNAKFSIIVDKSQNVLTLMCANEPIKHYIVSTGLNNSTPVGTFKIVNKLTNPVWFKAGAIVPPESPENILGSRWMGFDLAGYGIHGTVDPRNIGQQITQGCVRMVNNELEELYDIVPVGTEVTIIN